MKSSKGAITRMTSAHRNHPRIAAATLVSATTSASGRPARSSGCRARSAQAPASTQVIVPSAETSYSPTLESVRKRSN